MKRFAWSLVVANLLATQVQADEAAAVEAAPPVEAVVEIAIAAETTLSAPLVDPASEALMAFSGPAPDDQSLASSTSIDGEPLMHTMTLGGEEELTMNAAALGLPGLGDNRINLNAFGLFGEHRDQMRLQRDGQAVTTRKVGLLSMFGRNKSKSSQATVRTVSTTDRARAQKLAEIDKLRDEALRTGDRARLEQADRLEAQLRSETSTKPAKFSLWRK
uniref:Uncharacterized protein n=1 Tax=Schlesneria paludicola TaxID=360056 RepID=A0A7C2K2C4_9PLAN